MDGPPLPELLDFPGYVRHYASCAPERMAVARGAEGFSYQWADVEVTRYGAGLRRLGSGPGTVIAAIGDSRPECFFLFLACCQVGGVFLGLNPKHTARELLQVCEDAKPRVVFVLLDVEDRENIDKIAGILRGISSLDYIVVGSAAEGISGISLDEFLESGDPDDGESPAPRDASACALVYTSGSTGVPKGALLPQIGLLRSATLTWRHWYGGMAEIRTIAQHPINHVAWLTCECLAALVAGGTLHFRERFDAASTLRLIEEEKINLWFTFPAMAALVMASPEFGATDLSSLERVAFGSAPSVQLLHALRDHTDAVVSTSYGLTEACGGAVTATRDDDELEIVAGSVGRVVGDIGVRIVDQDGREASPGEPGELLISDPTVFLGYLGRPAETAAAIDAEGWLCTGDLVTRDSDGVVRLVGRKRDMFKSGGYNVYPAEIEQVLCQYPGVMAAAVVDAPDPVWGHVGVAYLVLAEEVLPDADGLTSFLRARLANYKVPKQVRYMSGLPRLANGKVDKSALRSSASSSSTGAARSTREAS